MTPELMALVARMEGMMSLNHNAAERLRDDTIAALREQAGEIERLEQLLAISRIAAQGFSDERDTLRAGFLGNPPKYVMWHEFESMRAEVAMLKLLTDGHGNDIAHLVDKP